MPSTILISGGAGYVGSHVAYLLKREGLEPVVLDNLSAGNAWATSFGPFEQGDIGDAAFVSALCEKYAPVAVLHFAAQTSANSPANPPDDPFKNNRETSLRFFKTLNACNVKKIVFSSTAAVYGDTGTVYSGTGGNGPISELYPARPTTPFAQSMLDAEAYLRMLDAADVRSATIRTFNVAGAAPIEAQIGEVHAPETHLIPRLILSLIDAPADILKALNLDKGFSVFGNDFPTPDKTAIRDYVHVMDAADAHMRALYYLFQDGPTDIFNVGNGKGLSVLDIVNVSRTALNRPGFSPLFAPRREGEQAVLIASPLKAQKVLGWRASRPIGNILTDAATWQRSALYQDALRAKLGLLTPSSVLYT